MNFIPNWTCRPLTVGDRRNHVVQRRTDTFMVKVRQRYSDNLKVLKEAGASEIVEIIAGDEDDDYDDFIPYKDDVEGLRVMP